jgi:hypothetical protein
MTQHCKKVANSDVEKRSPTLLVLGARHRFLHLNLSCSCYLFLQKPLFFCQLFLFTSKELFEKVVSPFNQTIQSHKILSTNFMLPNIVIPLNWCNSFLVYLRFFSIAINFHQAKHTAFTPFLTLVIGLHNKICLRSSKRSLIHYVLV